ncbi:TcdA/TcdB catalytic glycosyltransferase domain-containing protein [Vibrio sp. F74]|uniref:TcdA/TcdB catalytic glycosyltransferase domain-containing protein n=1 Tax=Vibrio sp. F74 TaxID=700020 RepID=UPI0035F5998A
MYIQELLLRGNPAAASDILRLSILYNKGGIYIDVDTLPPMQCIYGPISEEINPNIINVIRSEYFLRNWRDHHGLGKERNIDLSQLENYLSIASNKTLQDIKNKSKEIQSVDFSMKNTYVIKDLISIAGLERSYEYNNNVLISAKGSRLVRIILREIKHRYRFVQKNKYDLGIKNKESSYHSLHRLSNYRYDTFDDKDNVTLFLTGPSVILEVLLSVTYALLNIDRYTSARALSYVLRLNCVSITFSEHTNYTPEHIKSSWM